MSKKADTVVLELSIRAMSKAFNEFIGKCLDAEGKPKQPTIQAMMKARGHLPPYCDKALSRRMR